METKESFLVRGESMRLAYMWVQNYRDLFIDQEFRFSNQVLVSKTILESKKSEVKLNIRIEKNEKYFFGNDFYGGNILDAAVAVGRNGAGKTSLISMLLETMPNIMELNQSLELVDNKMEINEETKSKYHSMVQVFLSDEADDLKIFVYCHNVNVVNEESYPEIEFLKRWECRFQLSYLSFTNVFNWTELINKSYGTEENDWLVQKSVSPAAILKNSSEEYKKLFGYCTNQNIFIRLIQDFAVEKSKDALQYYLQVEQRVLVEFMLTIDKQIKKKLNISDTYDIKFIEFDSNLPIQYFWDSVNHRWDAEKTKNLSAYDQSVLEAQRIYILLTKKIEKHKDRFALNVYIYLLTEMYLAVCADRDNEIVKEICIYAEDQENFDIENIDFKLLDRLCNELKKLLQLTNVLNPGGWPDQIFNCVEQLKELEKKEWVLTNRKFEWQNKEKLSDGEDSEFLKWFIEQFDRNSFFVRNISIDYKPLSSGETAFIHLMSYIMMELHKVKKGSTVFLMIDEVDCYLHPEWQRIIMSLLIQFLKTREDYKFQLLLTSHSPIILSDFCNEQVIRLERVGDFCKNEVQQKSTFGANISLLYTDTFFMNEGLIGLFAQNKIKGVINKLNQGVADEEMIRIIENIGDDFARKALQAKYDNIRREAGKIDSRDIINSCTPEELEKVREYIQRIREEDN